MEAATVENLDAAQPASRSVVFYSRGREERLIRRREVKVSDGLGGQRTAQEPIRIEFGPEGRYTAQVGKNKMVDSEAWFGHLTDEDLKARGQKPRGEERDEVDALRSHHLFGDRIHEEGAEGDLLEPREPVFLAELNRAVMALDLEAATALHAQEVNSHERKTLVTAAETAIEQIRAAQESRD